ncbi:PASTA domain-containing protein [Blastopirellula marina]|nr:PASTA domain-containing protein [Blastopirellula marina]
MKSFARSLTCVLIGLLGVASVAAAEPGDYAEVTADEAAIRVGNEVVATAKKGETYQIVEIRGEFYKVRVWTDQGERLGYLWVKQAKATPPPMYAPPAPDKYVRVKSADAAIKSGSDLIATAQVGDVLLLSIARPGWLWVKTSADKNAPAGWLKENLAERLEHHGPSQTGDWPSSIQTASVAWSDGGYVVTSDLPSATGKSFTLVGGDLQTSPVETTSTGVKVRLEDDGVLAPGTKSLWIEEESGAKHRLDLPDPALSAVVSSSRYDTFPDGQFVSIELTTPAPGMWLEGCQIIPGKEKPRMQRLEQDRSADLSFADIYQYKAKTYVRLAARDFGDDVTRWIYLRARAPWGATSDTIAVMRVGDKLNEKATTFKNDNSGPVDAVAQIPELELMPVYLAKQVLEAAGLQAEFVAAADLQAIKSPSDSDLVHRQGVPAGESRLIGGTILLSIGSTPTVDSAADASRLTIDVADTLSLTWIDQVTSPSFALDESKLNWLTSDPAATGVLPIAVDGGVSLDPERTDDETSKAAFLKLLLASTLASPLQTMPGPIGAVFRDLIADEDELQQRIGGENAFAIDDVADRVAKQLGVDWSLDDQAAMQSDWERYGRYRSTSADYDLQQNEFFADDLGVWIIVWLFEHKLYDPLKSTVPATDAQGRPLAVLFQPGQAPAWSGDVKLPILPPGFSAPPMLHISESVASLNQHASTPPAEDLAKNDPPKGDPVKHASDGPTTVRVPMMIRDPVAMADGKLGRLGLQVADAARLLDTDRVTKSSPAADVWVPSGLAVDLSAERRVPNVLGYNPDRVDSELRRFNFRAQHLGKVMSNDVAVRQSPESGEYASVDELIDVNFNAVMPLVEGKLAKEGIDALEERDLGYRANTKIFLQDKIVQQSPNPGVLVSHGDIADLVVHTKVPDITGLRLDVARKSLDDFDLAINLPNQLARGEDIVRGQNPNAGLYVPHQSNVRLSPVVTKVPNVVGYSLGDAETVLDARNDIGVRTIGSLLDRDRITGQNPRAGTEIERGQSVVLDARVPAPNVRGDNLFAAANTVRNAGGELFADIIGTGQQTDVVYSQSPNPGVLVMPRSTISLVPGVNIPSVRGLSTNDAQQRLANVNVSSRVTSSGTQETSDRSMFFRTVVGGQSHSGLHARSSIGQVNLSVTQYVPAYRKVPVVEGMAALNAVSAIERADLRVGAIIVRGGHDQIAGRRMSVGEFRGILLGQALATLLGGNSDGVRIQSATATGSSPGPYTELIAGDSVDIYVHVILTEGGK